MTYMLVFKRYAPFATFGGGFEGDTRTGPSKDRGASARTIGVVEFTDDSVSSYMLGYSSGSRWRRDAEMSFSKVAATVTIKTRSVGFNSFTAYTAGANPLVPLAPDIDTFVDLDVRFSTKAVVFSGKVRGDTFPNAEVWVYDGTLNSGYALLFDYRTGGGQNTGPSRLFGSGESTTLGDFQVTVPIDGAGKFLSCSMGGPPVQGS